MKPSFVYFGTPDFARIILDELGGAEYLPLAVVTASAKPKGRHLLITPSPVEQWAKDHNIVLYAPEKIRGNEEFIAALREARPDLFIVAAYGKILPQELLDIPTHGTLNVHPSLLPKYRGPSPVESAILGDDGETGVTIMLLDAELDHGPILTQQKVRMSVWPPKAGELESALAHEGGKLLSQTIAPWVKGIIRATEQDHSRATFTKKIAKSDGKLDLQAPAIDNLRKVRAFEHWPGAWVEYERGGKHIRLRITEAHINENKFVVDRVVPEGKSEMPYADFLRGGEGRII